MTRENYLNSLQAQNFNFIIYMFFIEKTGIVFTPEVFSQLLSDYLSSIAIRFLLDGDSLLESCERVAIDYFDLKFDVIHCIKEDRIVRTV